MIKTYHNLESSKVHDLVVKTDLNHNLLEVFDLSGNLVWVNTINEPLELENDKYKVKIIPDNTDEYMTENLKLSDSGYMDEDYTFEIGLPENSCTWEEFKLLRG